MCSFSLFVFIFIYIYIYDGEAGCMPKREFIAYCFVLLIWHEAHTASFFLSPLPFLPFLFIFCVWVPRPRTKQPIDFSLFPPET